MSEYWGYLWLLGLVCFMGWWFWQTMKPPPKDGDKHSSENRGPRFPGKGGRW